MQTWLLLALARPSTTASTADAADLDLDVPSIAKEVAELVLWDLDSDFPLVNRSEVTCLSYFLSVPLPFPTLCKCVCQCVNLLLFFLGKTMRWLLLPHQLVILFTPKEVQSVNL
jgi:hypothetical protein